MLDAGALLALLVADLAAQSTDVASDFLVDPRPYVSKVEASPDGRELAIMGMTSGSNVWMIENF